jgi:hypothetical protein
MGPLVEGKGSGVPIHRVVLLWANNDPVTIRRDQFDYRTAERCKLDDPATYRLYDSQNNHHIEIRAGENKKGRAVWSGKVVRGFDVAQQLSSRLRKLGELERPYRHLRKRLAKEERKGLSGEERHELSRRRLREWKQAFRGLRPQRQAIIDAYPLIDRSDNEDGRFVMSLCEGEMLLMKHKDSGEVGYFVVAKLEKPQSIVLVPHWDARAATERKDAENRKVPDSKRDQFAATPTDLKELAPPGHPHAVKVRVGALGDVKVLERD